MVFIVLYFESSLEIARDILMAKQILGVDIGSDSLKLALVVGKAVKKVVAVPMPHSLVKEGRVVSIDAMGDLIRSAMRDNGMHCTNGALVLPNDVAFVRNVTMQQMSDEELKYNLPYEFRDYISEDLKDYAFDYAVYGSPDSAPKAPKKPKKSKDSDGLGDGDPEIFDSEEPVKEEESLSMELMAAAVQKSMIEDSKALFHKAGMKLVKIAPAVCSFIPLIQSIEEANGTSGEYCILDLGYRAIRMYMFKGSRHIVTRMLETGLSTLDNAIAEAYTVDAHLAHTYLLTNYEDCQNKECCQNAYNDIAIELMRAVNFYRFSNPDSQLSDIWLCGGGTMLDPLKQAISETMDLEVHQASELLAGGKAAKKGNVTIQASGIAMY